MPAIHSRGQVQGVEQIYQIMIKIKKIQDSYFW